MDEVKQWFFETMAEKALNSLIKNGFDAIRVSDRPKACNEIMKRILPSQTVGMGGSVTIRQLGLIPQLEKQGNILYDHWKPGLTQDELMNIRRAQQTCDVFITGSNAITVGGELVNIDAACNRISSMVFGPKNVIIVAGWNKIVQDVPMAVQRIKNYTAPLNAKRLGFNLPCAKVGQCVDCDSPQRICRGTLILERKPFATNVLVIIIQEDLGY